eukprot:385494-Pleurochrysis_carterae.AAC.1
MAGMQEERRGDVAPVCGMLKEVFGTSVASGAEKRSRPFDKDISLLKFTSVSRWYVRESSDVLAIADGRWPAVSHVGLKETADGESGTRRRGHDGGVGSGGAPFKQSGVDGVEEEVVSLASPMIWVVVDHFYIQSSLLEERCDAVWSTE